MRLLQAALKVARRDAPRVVRGDLRHDLSVLASKAPPEATLVICHTAVGLAYVQDRAERERFGDQVRSLGARWVSNEGADVLQLTQPASAQPWPSGQFILAIDRVPVAQTDPHGMWMKWL